MARIYGNFIKTIKEGRKGYKDKRGKGREKRISFPVIFSVLRTNHNITDENYKHHNENIWCHSYLALLDVCHYHISIY
jgi:hypothetical protein